MPVISMFYGIIIMMQYNEHNPPHFHATYQGAEASFNLDGEIIAGDFPRKQHRMVEAWCLIHHDELVAEWDLAIDQKSVFRIEPLR